MPQKKRKIKKKNKKPSEPSQAEQTLVDLLNNLPTSTIKLSRKAILEMARNISNNIKYGF